MRKASPLARHLAWVLLLKLGGLLALWWFFVHAQRPATLTPQAVAQHLGAAAATRTAAPSSLAPDPQPGAPDVRIQDHDHRPEL